MRQLVRLAVELGISQVAVADGSGDRVRRLFDLLFDQLVEGCCAGVSCLDPVPAAEQLLAFRFGQQGQIR